ncbi:MAG: hypothetical protein DCF19_00150 [Pseudanabaena frigida]|uniref:Uncharacterized protein n=1 Tax=Pseudanabaena frigida TaxID=945775 RepID=A0A2W4WKC7_9CYAN|nr:MAG: hypothetical protein DCF19_00150 [Pseudanabaena frigida]
MKKSSLTLLSSPALLAAFLLSSNPAQANPNNDVNKDVNSFSTSVVITREDRDSAQNNTALNDRANILTSDRIGDLAISKLGCDCMGCRQAVLSLVSK